MDHLKAKRMLLARRRDVFRRVDRMQRQADGLHEEREPDQLDQAAEAQQEDTLERLAAEERRIVDAVDAALHRLAEGKYGICVRCGNQIEEGRLRVRPECALCLSCAEGAEAGLRAP